jgi:hypothetical protein
MHSLAFEKEKKMSLDSDGKELVMSCQTYPQGWVINFMWSDNHPIFQKSSACPSLKYQKYPTPTTKAKPNPPSKHP